MGGGGRVGLKTDQMRQAVLGVCAEGMGCARAWVHASAAAFAAPPGHRLGSVWARGRGGAINR